MVPQCAVTNREQTVPPVVFGYYTVMFCYCFVNLPDLALKMSKTATKREHFSGRGAWYSYYFTRKVCELIYKTDENGVVWDGNDTPIKYGQGLFSKQAHNSSVYVIYLESLHKLRTAYAKLLDKKELTLNMMKACTQPLTNDQFLDLGVFAEIHRRAQSTLIGKFHIAIESM